MLTSIEIAKLRGIRQGKLDELSPLTVLVGPNGAGKSTILEAVLISASWRPDEAIGMAVRRRAALPHGARWLIWQGAQEREEARLQVRFRDGSNRQIHFQWTHEASEDVQQRLAAAQAPPPYSELHTSGFFLNVRGTGYPAIKPLWVGLAADNHFVTADSIPEPFRGTPPVWLVDNHTYSLHAPLDALYSAAVQRGRKADVVELLRGVVPGLNGMEILTEHGTPVLFLDFSDGRLPVPAELAGDGVRALLRLSMELAQHASGTALLEEPEARSHPAGVHQSAKAIVAAVRRGLQVIMSTHSLELLDSLLAELRDEELGLLSVYRVKLDAGDLRSSRIPGEAVARARVDIGDDLR